MSLTLKNYTKQLSKELIQLAEKNAVRECDETGNGHFIAYVDEGSNSFDVSLTVLPNNEIGKSTCDCKNNVVFCRHKTALLMHIANDKKIKGIVKIKKKASNAEALLEQADFGQLKDWLKSLFEKNKEIELTFLHHFSVKKQYHTAEEVIKLIKDAIKATGSNKKNIDATQLRKLVELWSNVLQPVVEYYYSNVMDEKAFQSFHTLVENCLQFQVGSSTRVTKYIDEILQKSQAPINNLLNEDAWYKAVGFFVEHVPDTANNRIRMYYLLHLQNLIVACNSENREKIIDLLVGQFKKVDSEYIVGGSTYAKTIFGIVETHNLLPQYFNVFKPLHFDNDFNKKLITLLIENGHFKLAVKYCAEQIGRNYREEYNVPYLKLLKEIYTIQKDEAKLANVLTALFPYSFNFDDYLFIIDRLQPDEKKKWRTKILTRARNAIRSYYREPVEFCFKLVDYEKDYKKMIGYIDSYTPYDIILKYFEPMVSADKTKLLDAIINKSDDDWSPYSSKAEKEDSCFPELFDITEKYYKADYLRMVIRQQEKNRYYFRPGRFFVYMKERLIMHVI
ncbi:MAG TPA: hypothetical protein VGN20_00045 [Mucilaginibacter sp.]|jgi:hypothetical protein